MGLRIRLAIGAALLLCGCSSDPPPIEGFTIVFQLDTKGIEATCRSGVGLPPPLTCASFPMTCDARVAIRLLDLPPENPDDQPKLRDDGYCLLLNWEERFDDVCPLGDPEFLQFVRFNDVTPSRGQIEVTIWRDSEAVANCPMIPYDPAGRPIPQTDETNPAFGRRVIFDFGGQDPIVEVPLACTNTDALIAASCEPRSTADLRVDVSDIRDLLNVTDDDAPFLGVQIGRPVEQAKPDVYEIVPLLPLSLAHASPPHWEEVGFEIPDELDPFEPGQDVCAVVTDFGAQPAVTCSTVEDAMTISLLGYMVADETLGTIQAAIGLSAIPTDGIVIGRVVDTNALPLDNVTVIPNTALPPVLQYLDGDMNDYRNEFGAALTATSPSGYFVARGVNFKTTWDAMRPGTWRVVGTPVGGELGNRTASVLIIEMTQDLKP